MLSEIESVLARLETKSQELWGPADEKGSLNWLTPECRVAAAGEIREGTAVSLSRSISPSQEGVFGPPHRKVLEVKESFGQPPWAIESWSFVYHGCTISHIDAWSHCTWNGRGYGRRKASDLVSLDKGATIGAVEADAGIFTRGVLLDAAMDDQPWLEPGAAVSRSQLLVIAQRCHISLRAGDILLVRTGQTKAMREAPGGFASSYGTAGLHWDVAEMLLDAQVAILGSDAPTDCYPPLTLEMASPTHVLCLVGMGMPLLDNLDLEQLSIECKKRQRWSFAISISPLKLVGGTGSPVNAMALF